MALETHNPHNCMAGSARLIFEKTGLHLRIPNLLNKLSEILTQTHLYYDSFKDSKEKAQVELKIDRMTKHLTSFERKEAKFPRTFSDYFDLHYDEKKKIFLFGQEKAEVIERELGLCGYFAIITSAKMSAKEALDLYKGRDGHEKLFRGDKSYLGSKSVRVHSDESVNGKIFVEFVALIIRNRMYCRLKDEAEGCTSTPNYTTVPASIRELEKIEMIKQADGMYRLDHAVTARQKNILKPFDLDEEHVRDKAISIGKSLMNTNDHIISEEGSNGLNEIHGIN